MAGLPFQPLQGTQPDPQFAGGVAPQAQPQMQQQQQMQVPDVPQTTPGLILENDLRQKLQYIEYLENQLVDRKLSPDEHEAEVLKLKAAVDDTVYEFAAKQRKLRETQQLIDLGVLDSQKGQQALWSMALPPQAADAQPSLRPTEQGTPYSPSSLKGIDKSASEFAIAAPSTGEWLTGSKNEPRSESDLLTQYRAWKQYIGYDALPPVKQRQVDNEWDSVMKAKPKWKWNPTSAAVQAERPQGTLAGAYLGKRPSMTGGMTSPVSDSIRKQVDSTIARTEKPKLTKEEAGAILLEADGDKTKARQLAIERGYRL